MAQYRLLRGTHVDKDGTHEPGTKTAIVESKVDLVKTQGSARWAYVGRGPQNDEDEEEVRNLGAEFMNGGVEEAEDDALEGMTVKELRQYANDQEIDLHGATTKAEIVNTIRVALDTE